MFFVPDREQIEEMEHERNREREREWNKPNPKTSRSASNLSLQPQERSRIVSQTARSVSPLPRSTVNGSGSSPTTPDRPHSPILPRTGSPAERQRAPSHTSSLLPTALRRHSSHGSPRTSSPTGSVRSVGSGAENDEVKHVVDLERERNWNAPRPKWGEHRSISPLPPSPTHSYQSAHPPLEGRVRVTSLSAGKIVQPAQPTSRGKPPKHAASLPNGNENLPPVHHASTSRSVSSTHKSAQSHRAPTPPLRPSSPPPSQPKSDAASLARSGWSFPRNKTSLPPLELEETPERLLPLNGHVRAPGSPSPAPRPRTSSRVETGNSSQIPLSKKGDTSLANGHAHPQSGSKKGHRRTTTELISGPSGTPAVQVEVNKIGSDTPRHEDPTSGWSPF
jgi:serine/arginine repetitive matrix protein 2